MKPKVITNKSEYEAALERIEMLMDTTRNTPQGDDLELLALVVHDYENRVYPIAKPDSATAIRFRLEQQGLDPKGLPSRLVQDPQLEGRAARATGKGISEFLARVPNAEPAESDALPEGYQRK